MSAEYEYKDVKIKDLKQLLEEGVEFEVDTPDSWQTCSAYVDKGDEEIYHLMTDREDIIRCAAKHLFETRSGMGYAKDLVDDPFLEVLCNDGEYHRARVFRGGYKEKIVDISIDHKNHRYYTNGVSSHNSGVGKSGFMTNYSAEMITQGYNVLYVSMEMNEAKLAQRVDANLLDMTMDDIENLEEIQFMDKISRIQKKGLGKLLIKEYPTGTAHMGHVDSLLRELKNKKGFVPDIVCLDYMNICVSRRVTLNKGGSYLFVKSIAEEFRGLAVKHRFIGVSAAQGNRSTIESSDIGMQDTGESKGINDTVDFMLGMMAPEEIASQGLMLCKQLKSRYANINKPGVKRFLMTYEREKMKFGDADDVEDFSSYTDPHNTTDTSKKKEDKPLFDESTSDRFLEDNKAKNKKDFSIKF